MSNGLSRLGGRDSEKKKKKSSKEFQSKTIGDEHIKEDTPLI